jgi:microcystin-dependent protein
VTVAKYLDPADGQWKPIPVPPHIHPGQGRIPGEVIAYAGATPPPGWLVCDGSEIKAADYPLLAAVLGTWGPAGAVFLPDLRDRSVIGVGPAAALGQAIGAATHTHAADPLPAHTHGAGALAAHVHSVPAASTTKDAHSHTVNVDAFTSGSAGSHGHTVTAAGGHAHGLDTATQAVTPGQATIRHVTATDTKAAGSHTHPVATGGSHSHSVNPPATASSSDEHGHTVAARNTGPMSAGTPNVADASAGTPTIKAGSSYHPSLSLTYIIFAG